MVKIVRGTILVKKTRVKRDDTSLLDTGASDDSSDSNASITRGNLYY